MIYDILISVYIIMLFPFLYECEKLENEGLKILLIGIILTPLAGFPALFLSKKKTARRQGSLT